MAHVWTTTLPDKTTVWVYSRFYHQGVHYNGTCCQYCGAQKCTVPGSRAGLVRTLYITFKYGKPYRFSPKAPICIREDETFAVEVPKPLPNRMTVYDHLLSPS